MLKCFTKPIKIMIFIFLLSLIGLMSDITQLTGINLLNIFIAHAPLSYIIFAVGFVMIYCILVLIQCRKYRNENMKKHTKENGNNEKSSQTNSETTLLEENGINIQKTSATANQQSIRTGDVKDSTISQIINNYSNSGPMLDNIINESIENIRKSRLFANYDLLRAATVFATNLTEGEYIGGSNAVKSRALAWCVRFLADLELAKAEQYLKIAQELDNNVEVIIAEAFVISKRGNLQKAINILAEIGLPIARSAALIIEQHHKGAQAAIDWLKETGILPSDLDSEGKYFLLIYYFQIFSLEAAEAVLRVIDNEDYMKAPGLYHVTAITRLQCVVPNELRYIIVTQMPFDLSSFPLAADACSLRIRESAHDDFLNASSAAKQLKCHESEIADDEYALWLELKDPDNAAFGINRLEEKLRNPKSPLRFIRLAIQFGIPINLEEVEIRINNQISLYGASTLDTAIARYALAFTKKDPNNIADYIEQHFRELERYVDKKQMRSVQVELYSQTEQSERAKECFDILLAYGITIDEENRLHNIINKVKGTDHVDKLIEQFGKTDGLHDLIILVGELYSKKKWLELCKYSKILFEKTRTINDAELYSIALSNTGNYKCLVHFMRTNSELVDKSRNLQMSFCWALYFEGFLLEALSKLSTLGGNWDDPNFRALQTNVRIALGDWDWLNVLVANENDKKEQRSADQLLHIAQIAVYIGSPLARELIFELAQKAESNADILINAYLLASNAGIEDSTVVSHWLSKSAELSNDNGPIHKVFAKDIIDMKQDWDRQNLDALQSLCIGDIPMFIASKAVNSSLVNTMLFPSLTNLKENDPRRRKVIFAYAGNRKQALLKSDRSIAIDVTALLSLNFLGILDKVMEYFNKIYISHSSLIWLFDEKQKATYHQPSRIRYAHILQNYISAEVVKILSLGKEPDVILSDQVGHELASLISQAEEGNKNGIQNIVIHPGPIKQLGLFSDDEVDLTAHTEVFSSCQSISERLKHKGLITTDEYEKIKTYFQLIEKSWCDQPIIGDGSILYFDRLSIYYFLRVGILEKLKLAGYTLVISPQIVSEANSLILYENYNQNIMENIESLRSILHTYLLIGKIQVGRRQINSDREIRDGEPPHPCTEIISLAGRCEAIIVDDRFINKHEYIEDSDAKTPIFTSLDILDSLVLGGSISSIDRFEYKTKLRQAGYCFVSIDDDELEYHLNASIVDDQKIIETAELRAIRESILHVKMSTCLQLPREAMWLDTIIKTFVRVLHNLWISGSDYNKTRVYSTWIIKQIDFNGWAHCFDKESGDIFIKKGRGAFIQLLISPPNGATEDSRIEYWSWIENTVLEPLKEENELLYTSIVEWYRKYYVDFEKKVIEKGVTLNG